MDLPPPRLSRSVSVRELTQALARVRLPALLKISRLGYDGKGQALDRDRG